MNESLIVGIGVILSLTALGIVLWKYYPVQTKAFFRIGDKAKPKINNEEIKKVAKANLDSIMAGIAQLHEDLLELAKLLHDDLADVTQILKQLPAPGGNGSKPAEAIPELTTEQKIEALQNEILQAVTNEEYSLAESKTTEIKKLRASLPVSQPSPEDIEAKRKAWGEKVRAAKAAKKLTEKSPDGSDVKTE